MKFCKYQHVERWGTEEVEGIELGRCYIFPKLDGSQLSIWYDKRIRAGSRNRELSLGADNQGVFKYICKTPEINEKLEKFFKDHPNKRLFAEWLVKHTISQYCENAWRKFYVFDVVEEFEKCDCGKFDCVPFDNDKTCQECGKSCRVNNFRYLPYEEYKELCDQYQIEYIPAFKIIQNPTYEDVLQVAKENHYLLPDDVVGEGCVIKRYDFKNKWGRTTWAKLVLAEFKEDFIKKMGSPEKENKLIEEEIVENYCTSAFIEKCYAKVVNERDGWRSQYIPHLIGLCWTDFIKEESFHFVKKYKNPIINFKILNYFVINKVKKVKQELF